jgi:hypothetical protein
MNAVGYMLLSRKQRGEVRQWLQYQHAKCHNLGDFVFFPQWEESDSHSERIHVIVSLEF